MFRNKKDNNNNKKWRDFVQLENIRRQDKKVQQLFNKYTYYIYTKRICTIQNPYILQNSMHIEIYTSLDFRTFTMGYFNTFSFNILSFFWVFIGFGMKGDDVQFVRYFVSSCINSCNNFKFKLLNNFFELFRVFAICFLILILKSNFSCDV